MDMVFKDVLVLTHRRTGLYHILITGKDHGQAIISVLAYWNQLATRNHKTINYAVKEFCKYETPFVQDDFSYEVRHRKSIPQKAKAQAIDLVIELGTEKLLTAQLGFVGASWTLNILAQRRLETNERPPYVIDQSPMAEIRSNGEVSLRTADGVTYIDQAGDRFEKLCEEDVAKFFGDGYLVTSGHRGLRVYKKLKEEV